MGGGARVAKGEVGRSDGIGVGGWDVRNVHVTPRYFLFHDNILSDGWCTLEAEKGVRRTRQEK